MHDIAQHSYKRNLSTGPYVVFQAATPVRLLRKAVKKRFLAQVLELLNSISVVRSVLTETARVFPLPTSG